MSLDPIPSRRYQSLKSSEGPGCQSLHSVSARSKSYLSSTHAAVVNCSSNSIGTGRKSSRLGSQSWCGNLTNGRPSRSSKAAGVVEYPNADDCETGIEDGIVDADDAHRADEDVQNASDSTAIDDQGAATGSLDDVE